MKKTIGIIGAGNIAKAVATHLLHSGFNVTISNSRTPDTLKDTIAQLGNGAKAVTMTEVAEADMVILALPWLQVNQLKGITNWKNKIVIDATNHFINANFQLADLGDLSSSEVVLSHLPGARLVKAFNTLYYKILEESPKVDNGSRVLFVSGDDNEATLEVSELITDLGFAPVDLGSLAVGSKLQQPRGPLSSLNIIKI